MSLILGRSALPSETQKGVISLNNMPWKLDDTLQQAGRVVKSGKMLPKGTSTMGSLFSRGISAKIQNERFLRSGGGIDPGDSTAGDVWSTRGVVSLAPVDDNGAVVEFPVPISVGGVDYMTQGGKNNQLKIVQNESVEDVLDNALYEADIAEKSAWLLTRFKNDNYARSWMNPKGFNLLKAEGTGGAIIDENEYKHLGLNFEIFKGVNALPSFLSSIPRNHMLFSLGTQKMVSVLEKNPLILSGGINGLLSGLKQKGFDIPFSVGSTEILDAETVNREKAKILEANKAIVV
jgi:hypothetical protein